MITFSLLGKHGRLGNQMFQYSLLKSVSIKNNLIFAIPKQNHQLFDCFDLKCKVYDLEKYSDIMNRLKLFQEVNFNYDESVFKCVDNVDFKGNFQSEKYFYDIKDQINNDFTFKKEILEKSQNQINAIKSKKEIVSIHVRRGDYVNLQDYHPLCSIEYYLKSIEKFDGCEFLCFSDDIEWCKDAFKDVKNISYSCSNNPYIDLCTMTLCDHNIIANSSFSWWGAWLNKNKNKKIIAPIKWFGKNYDYLNINDLIPEGWTKI